MASRSNPRYAGGCRGSYSRSIWRCDLIHKSCQKCLTIFNWFGESIVIWESSVASIAFLVQRKLSYWTALHPRHVLLKNCSFFSFPAEIFHEYVSVCGCLGGPYASHGRRSERHGTGSSRWKFFLFLNLLYLIFVCLFFVLNLHSFNLFAVSRIKNTISTVVNLWRLQCDVDNIPFERKKTS